MRRSSNFVLTKPRNFFRPRARFISNETRKTGSRNSNKEIIFSGIQPTGIPHLGNYLGALRQWKDYQDQNIGSNGNPERSHELFFSVVDLHALTGKQSRDELVEARLSTFASFLAIGLDPKLCTMFMQSDVLFHAELMWILSTVASTGYLSRMTQWKSKLGLSENTTISDDAATAKLKLGLFSYPVLQAADILLYKTTLVPVGEDQRQHVEFTRDLARGFNSVYCSDLPDQVFTVPRADISSAKRIMSLRDPTAKMSKSHTDPRSRILITDSEEEIRAKIKGALTDSEEGISFDPNRRPGVSNLVEILKHVTKSSLSCEEVANEHQTTNMRSFKELVANETIKSLAGFRDTFISVMNPENPILADAVEDGKIKALTKAGDTMAEVRRALGIQSLHSQMYK